MLCFGAVHDADEGEVLPEAVASSEGEPEDSADVAEDEDEDEPKEGAADV